MSERCFMGIDGGGSSLRIAISAGDMRVINSLKTSAANPNLLGAAQAQKHIRAAIADCLRGAGMPADSIHAAAIGIAGASAEHSRDWLLATLEPVLPGSFLVPASDLEIALVGALAKRHGLLLLAGTGSAAFGIAPSGRRLQIGGWGYLLGDPGSSYWIGLQALQQMIDAYDRLGAHDETWTQDSLFAQVMASLGIADCRQIIDWLYRSQSPPATRIAKLAKLVLALAEAGNGRAFSILQRAAMHLARQANTLKRRLDFPGAQIAFAGGLLDHDNLLARQVATQLGLARRPLAKHPPVIGAALLAKLEWERLCAR